MRVLILAILVLASTAAQAFEIKHSAMEKSLKKYLQEIPQCKVVEVPKARMVKDGAVAYYNVNGLTKVDVMMDIDGGKVRRVTVYSPESRSDDVMQDMMCLTYALMRAIQPDLADRESALREAKDLWVRSAKKPFRKAFYFDHFTAQLVPVQVVAE